jgi:hypothetical protein
MGDAARDGTVVETTPKGVSLGFFYGGNIFGAVAGVCWSGSTCCASSDDDAPSSRWS